MSGGKHDFKHSRCIYENPAVPMHMTAVLVPGTCACNNS